MPTDYKKLLPDFDKINNLYKALYKRQISLREAKEIQAIWLKKEPDKLIIPPKQLF